MPKREKPKFQKLKFTSQKHCSGLSKHTDTQNTPKYLYVFLMFDIPQHKIIHSSNSTKTNARSRQLTTPKDALI